MICVFPPDATDFSTNGLGVVDPHVCRVTETLNGEWELTLEHMIDDAGKWSRLAENNIILAPVPAAMTPALAARAEAVVTDIYKVQTGGMRLNMRAKPSLDAKIIRAYKPGTEVISLGISGDWREVTAPDGARGYMWASNTVFVRAEASGVQAAEAIVEPRQLRDQPFRIYRAVPELDKVTVYARHIFYDMMDNMIQSYRPAAGATGAQVLAGIAGNCLSAHDFVFASDLTSTAEEVEFENVNPVEAILGADGLIEKCGGELARDWYDVYVVERVGNDSGVQVREGKNLLGVSYDLDLTDVVTRIMPTGEDKDGKALYLPEMYIDSPNIGDSPKWVHLPVSEAKEVTKGDDKKTKEQCYTEMRDAAAAEYEKGCDAPKITLKVDFINCADTEEYKQYSALQNIYIGDGVRVLARRVGVAVTMRLTQYTYDCLTRKYTAMTLGTVADTIEGSTITARQLPNGVIRGGMIARGSVGAGQVIDGSIGALQIGLAAIQTAHIDVGTINTLTANAITAITAKIGQIAAEEITTDELYAAMAAITTLLVQQVVAGTITTDALYAALGEFVTLHAQTGTFNFATAQNLVAGALAVERASAAQVYITNLAVTQANLLNATIMRLVMPGADGKYYAVMVGAGGTITTEEVTVTEAEIAAGQTDAGQQIVATVINAESLNGQNISAQTAIINTILAGALDAGKITAGEAMLASATIPTLYAASIKSLGDSIDIGVVAGANLLRNSTFLDGWAGWPTHNEPWQIIAGHGDFPGFSIAYTGDTSALTGSFDIWSESFGAIGGADYSVSYSFRGDFHFIVGEYDAGGDALMYHDYESNTAAWATERRHYTFTSHADTRSLGVVLRAYAPHTALVYAILIAQGSTESAWSPSPEELIVGSSITITKDKVRISSPQTEISVPDALGDQVMAQIGAGGLAAWRLYADNAAPRYAGPDVLEIAASPTEAQLASGQYFRTLSAALATVSGRQLDRDVVIILEDGASFTEEAAVSSTWGAGLLWIGVSGVRATLNGSITVKNCQNQVNIINLDIHRATPGDGVRVENSRYALVSGCSLNGQNALEYAGVRFANASSGEVWNTEAQNFRYVVRAQGTSRAATINVSGVGYVAADMAEVYCAGTIGSLGTEEGGNGRVYADGCPTSAGSAVAPPQTLTTLSFSMAHSDSCMAGGWSKFADNDIRQGALAAGQIYGCIWFDNDALRGALAGKTIVSAGLRLTRASGYGLGGPTPVRLHGITMNYAGRTGPVSLATDYGLLGHLAWGETATFQIPASAAADLESGAINALSLYIDDTEMYGGRSYSENYARFFGETTGDAGNVPVLTVTHS